MKILHVIPYVSAIYGGPVEFLKQITKTTASHANKITVITTTANGDKELELFEQQSINSSTVEYNFFKRIGPKNLFLSFEMRKWINKNLKNYNIIHIHGNFSFAGLIAARQARNEKIPYIITTHGMLDKFCYNEKKWKKIPYYHLLERDNLKNASAIHVTSIFEEKFIENLGYKDNIKIIPLSVEQTETTKKYNKKENYTLLFMSRIDPIKGIDKIIEAILYIKKNYEIKFKLKIAGTGNIKYINQLKKLISKYNLNDHIDFLGFVSGEEKQKLLSISDVFILPSEHENFSISTAEAMASGLPVIISDQVGLANEILEAEAGIVININNINELSQSIMKYYNSDLREINGKNGRKLVQSKFASSNINIKYLNLYSEILKKNKCDFKWMS